MGQYIDLLFFERVTDISTRETIRRARAFCRYHARRVSQQADALGTAIIMKDVLINDLRDIDAGSYDGGGSGSPFARFFDSSDLPERTPCPLCVREAEIEELTTDRLLEGLADADFVVDFRRSDGLCVPHFRLAFSRGRAHPQWSVVVDTERSALERLPTASATRRALKRQAPGAEPSTSPRRRSRSERYLRAGLAPTPKTSRNQAAVRSTPVARPTTGSHPRAAFALLMSGQRRDGSLTGRGR